MKTTVIAIATTFPSVEDPAYLAYLDWLGENEFYDTVNSYPAGQVRVTLYTIRPYDEEALAYLDEHELVWDRREEKDE